MRTQLAYLQRLEEDKKYKQVAYIQFNQQLKG